MEPQVKYARTEDGVNIAYYTLGSGPPLIWLAMPAGHTTAEWKIPPLRASIEAASRFFTVVRIDPRGFGLSDRHATDISFRSMAHDLKAVSDKESLGPAVVLGLALASGPAIHFAAVHPELVSHLVLLSPAAKGWRSPLLSALRDLSLVDWDFAADTIMRSFWTESPMESEAFGELLRESVDPQTLHELVYVTEKDFDISAELQGLSMPTLVLHDRSNQNHPIEASKQAAALIPQGRFVEIDNTWRIAAAVARFLSETGLETRAAGPAVTSRAKPDGPAASGTAIILFADIVDSTALTERLGDTSFREKARDLDAALRSAIRERSGTPIEGKLLGDGVLATFASARHAIEAAIACGAAGASAGLPLHLGLHAGDVIREDNNVFGGAVNVASRISGLSAPGEVLVSHTVRDLARTSSGVSFEDRGEQTLKGVSEPVRVWAVREGE